MLYDYCAERDVPHRKIGKLIVATSDSELSTLELLRSKAEKNGVLDLEWLDTEHLQFIEPSLRGVAALRSPSSGIVDSHSLMESFQADIESNGGVVVLNTAVDSLQASNESIRFQADGVDFGCALLVNAAGLWAPQLAEPILRQHGQSPPRQYFAKGHYFSYSGKSPFNHLIYPVPVDGGLGIHATNDLSGAARFGPDVRWTETLDYSFEEGRRGDFESAIRRYFPDLDEQKLQPSYTGIRPKLSPAGHKAEDFRIDGPEFHGIPRLFNLFGIESPGLTSALAISDYIAKKIAA